MFFELHDEFSKISDLMKKVLRKTQHSEDSTHLSNQIEHINSNFLLLFSTKKHFFK
jgi:glycine/serine hydroxymethyltransferase